jgi:hypothetical protein
MDTFAMIRELPAFLSLMLLLAAIFGGCYAIA